MVKSKHGGYILNIVISVYNEMGNIWYINSRELLAQYAYFMASLAREAEHDVEALCCIFEFYMDFT